LTVTASAESKTYGQTVTFSSGSTLFASSGLQNSQTIGSVTLAVSSNGGAATAAVGSYTITPSLATGGTFTASNYTITYNTGTLTVNPATLTITAKNDSKTYGTVKTFSGSAFTEIGLVTANGDTITAVTETSTGAPASATVGTDPIVPSGATGSGLSNYTIGYVNGTLTVNPATLTITANNQTKLYGQANPALTVSYTGFVNGDTPTSLTTAPSVTTTATTSSTVGTYPIRAAGAVDPNYTISYVAGKLTVILSAPSAGSLYVLDPSAGGALNLAGNANVSITGNVVVDSGSSSAILASGNAKVTAAQVLVGGGVSKSGNASVTKTGTPGATGDPLAGLTAPTYSGTGTSEILRGNSTATISPGVYSQITVSGNAQLTMNAGVYIIAGGGFSVSGNATITGSGVTIYNTKNSGGT
jgi:hypothetical protein